MRNLQLQFAFIDDPSSSLPPSDDYLTLAVDQDCSTLDRGSMPLCWGFLRPSRPCRRWIGSLPLFPLI